MSMEPHAPHRTAILRPALTLPATLAALVMVIELAKAGA